MSVPENRVKHLVYQAGRRAARNGVPFDIRLDDLLPLPTHCPVLGIELIYRGTGGRGFQHSSPSIDRFIPALGYVRGNVRIISMRANRIKCDATLDELRALVRYMEAAL